MKKSRHLPQKVTERGHTHASHDLRHVRQHMVVLLLRPIQPGRRCYRRFQLDHLSARSHEFAMLLPEPLLQVRHMPTVGQGWIGMLLGACPDAGQRRIDSSQVQRRQPAWHRCALRAGRRLRAIQRAYSWKGHLRQHAVRGRPHPALAPRQPGQGGQDAPALGPVGLALDPAPRSHCKCPAAGVLVRAAIDPKSATLRPRCDVQERTFIA